MLTKLIKLCLNHTVAFVGEKVLPQNKTEKLSNKRNLDEFGQKTTKNCNVYAKVHILAQNLRNMGNEVRLT